MFLKGKAILMPRTRFTVTDQIFRDVLKASDFSQDGMGRNVH
jgi:hypothetical protein